MKATFRGECGDKCASLTAFQDESLQLGIGNLNIGSFLILVSSDLA